MKYSVSTVRCAILVLCSVIGLCGCAHDRLEKPTMQKGNGAIEGKLLDSNGDPFDLSLAGEQGAKALRIELISSGSGVIASTTPQKDEPRFVFNNVLPGRYELNVYCTVPNKRTIAGSQTVTVDPDQTTTAKLTLEVTEQK